jgi:hypothetical protein
VSICEKFSRLGVKLHLNDGGIKFLCKGDQWIMEHVAVSGYRKEELERLNKVRIHQ